MSILVTRPLPQGEELVSRLRALGRVAWSFPLIEFTPGRQLLSWAASWQASPQAICSSRYLSMPSSLPTLASSSRGCAGPRRPTILPLAAPPRWPCIRSVIDKFATR